jgi:hypothetical protein
MAKIIEYPRASLRSALQLADAVAGFAGSCSTELAAEKLGKKMSGAFQALVSATVKYRLIESKAGKLSTTILYRNFKLAYTPEETEMRLREALLSPPLFANIYERFKGQKLPVSHFEKMLIREFDVPDEVASRVSGYFLDGAKQSGLLNSDGCLVSSAGEGANEIEVLLDDAIATPDIPASVLLDGTNNVAVGDSLQKSAVGSATAHDEYLINIRGPGINISIEVKELDDLDIVQVMLRKIERALKQADSNI